MLDEWKEEEEKKQQTPNWQTNDENTRISRIVPVISNFLKT